MGIKERFEAVRENCVDCLIRHNIEACNKTYTCTHEGDSFKRECCIELCPRLTREPSIEFEKETINLDRGVTAHTMHKIIDDAMEKKDRIVNIFMSEYGITIKVDPLVEHKARWIYRQYYLECSECGHTTNTPTPYCPVCGEKLAMTFDNEIKEGSTDEMSEV